MTTLTLRGSTIRIGRNLLSRTDDLPGDAPIITDRTVSRTPFYRRLRKKLKGPAYILPAGERSKTLRSAEAIYR